MEYFLLSQSASNPLQILGLDNKIYRNNLSEEAFEQLPSIMVAYLDYKPEVEITDVLEHPMFLVSDGLKELLRLYDEQIKWKAIQIFPEKEEDLAKGCPLYWAGNYAVQSCLHENSEFFPDTRIKQLVLDKRKLRHQDIFRIGGILEHRIVISLRLAESILRRNLYGIGLEPVEIK